MVGVGIRVYYHSLSDIFIGPFWWVAGEFISDFLGDVYAWSMTLNEIYLRLLWPCLFMAGN